MVEGKSGRSNDRQKMWHTDVDFGLLGGMEGRLLNGKILSYC